MRARRTGSRKQGLGVMALSPTVGTGLQTVNKNCGSKTDRKVFKSSTKLNDIQRL